MKTRPFAAFGSAELDLVTSILLQYASLWNFDKPTLFQES